METKLGINNTKSKAVCIKSLLGSCDLKISDKVDYIIIISTDKGSYRFFADSQAKIII
jgi:hypothetical protein